ncbi:MAG: hypothetical protein OXI59_23555, partial [Gemmatimonadota bacterium]|nr:hypothetical protein [Gemmatimonadota bacterium]
MIKNKYVLCTMVCLLAGLGFAQGPDGPEAITVYLTEEQALKKAFPDADTIWRKEKTPTQQERWRTEQRLCWNLDGLFFLKKKKK